MDGVGGWDVIEHFMSSESERRSGSPESSCQAKNGVSPVPLTTEVMKELGSLPAKPVL